VSGDLSADEGNFEDAVEVPIDGVLDLHQFRLCFLLPRRVRRLAHVVE